MITTSEWQGLIREDRSEGSRTQNCELMNKNIIWGIGWRRVSTRRRSRWFNGHCKWCSCAAKVNAFIRGDLLNGGRIQWHPKTLKKFKQQVWRLTNRNWGVSMKYQLFKTSQFIRGWINYFGVANCYQLCVDLDHWIRLRVRMAYWRQWRKPRTKVRSLMKLGVRVQSAVARGIVSTTQTPQVFAAQLK